ncbi:MAG: TetR/AcrR family transcriptional regulator C-terminal domain-containing protein [Gaiellaceae bacterium]|jgi:AcrR family transcriptional regulator
MKDAESKERAPLTRRAVIEAALSVGDSEGLEAISLRRVARDLGVTPMALYRYVDSKEGLLEGIVERVFEEFELPPESEDDWREEMRALARSFRRLLVAHPAVTALFSMYPAETDSISQNGARIVEFVLSVLRRAGFPPKEAALIEGECERFILGMVVLEMTGGPQPCPFNPKATQNQGHVSLALLPPEEFPHLLEALPYFSKYQDPEWAFEFALDLIVGGLEHLLTSGHSRLDSV